MYYERLLAKQKDLFCLCYHYKMLL